MNLEKPRTTSLEFAALLFGEKEMKLSGYFVDEQHSKSYQQQTTTELTAAVATHPASGAIRNFLEMCKQYCLDCEVALVPAHRVDEIMKQSRYADLLLIDPSMNYGGETEQAPSSFVRQILSRAECPVVLAPDEISKIDEVVFCYDGSASSIYAIKQFTYLFAWFRTTKIVLLQVNGSAQAIVAGPDTGMVAWLNDHYDDIDFQILRGRASDSLFKYLLRKKNHFVVMGAYGRSLLSQFFKHSAANIIIRTIDIPLFITHKS